MSLGLAEQLKALKTFGKQNLNREVKCSLGRTPKDRLSPRSNKFERGEEK